MGIRGEIYSTAVGLQNRTYFFNVKENRLGDLYLNIVESKNRDSGGFERQSVILFADDLSEFLKGFDESLRALEKAVKEKRRSSARGNRGEEGSGDRRPGRAGTEEAPGKKRYAAGRAKPGAGGSAGPGGRKVVVKKRKDI
ncbi:MAG: DUF3276 family protein [Treponema sp.]|jgi:hypothetical protein|nr:DUF3276 family protein [Treponema sp.]